MPRRLPFDHDLGVADRHHCEQQRTADAADRGAQLTSSLLAFARKQPLQPSDVDVNALMVDTIELLRPTIGDHVDIDFRPMPDLPHALVDANQLVTAIINLALNARDVDAMQNYGWFLCQQRRFPAAAEQFERALQQPQWSASIQGIRLPASGTMKFFVSSADRPR